MYRSIITIFFIATLSLPGSDVVLSDSSHFNRLCHLLHNTPHPQKGKDLNAFLLAKKRHQRHKQQQQILAKNYLVRLSSDQFFLENYNFRDGYFLINSFTIKNTLFILRHPLKIKVTRRKAIEVALLKELGELELYLRFNLHASSPQGGQYCAWHQHNPVFFPEISGYILASLKGQEHLLPRKKKRGQKKLFLKSPMIEGLPAHKAKKLKNKLIHLNRRIAQCVSPDHPGIRLYRLKIDKSGRIRKVGSSYSTLSKSSETCIDDLLKNQRYPAGDRLDYQVYFSIVVSNLKK